MLGGESFIGDWKGKEREGKGRKGTGKRDETVAALKSLVL